MEFLDRESLREQINRLAAADTAFLFLIDYQGSRGLAVALDQLSDRGIYCSIGGVELGKKIEADFAQPQFEILPPLYDQYQASFDKVARAIAHGDTYLLNLTYPSELCGKIDFRSVYHLANARYKFMIEDQFLFYSPEPFVRIDGGKIYSFPMKGTIDAHIDEAERKLIESKKELYEHYTIVDLIRNDLSMVAHGVEVEDFRYVETINTAKGSIIQTSSRISGTIDSGWTERLGDIILSLLPAGSISGAPKERTAQIIDQAEISPRGFYTGVMGLYANQRVDSCVNIRYLERRADGRCFYHSGGGITALSDVKEEYQELLTKIYVPIA